MDYVNKRLELRLQRRLTDAKLSALQRDFADILADGRFEQEADPVANGTPPVPFIRLPT